MRDHRRWAALIGLIALAALAVWAWSGGWDQVLAAVRDWQMEMRREFAAAIRAVRADGWSAVGPLATLSFIYGVVHAAGPGHGKAVIGAYVLADGRRLRRGLVIAWAAALAQAVTALTLVFVTVSVLGLAGRQAQPAAEWMERAGYALVIALGLVTLWRGWVAAKGQRAGHGPDHEHHDHGHHDHEHHHHHEHGPSCGHGCGHVIAPPPAEGGWRAATLLVASVGMRPCGGALLVLTFAIGLGVQMAGVAAVFAMAVGTAITVSILAVLAVGSRRLAVAAAGGDGVWIGRIETALVIGAGLALTVMGALLLISSLTPGPAAPFR